MAKVTINAPRILGLVTSVPRKRFDNVRDTREFSPDEVRKVVGMAGVAARRVVHGSDICSADLCYAAAEELFRLLDCDRDTVDAAVLVTQTPDYFMPSSSCVLQDRLGLGQHCAALDVNQGCSGYVYGLWLASSMLSSAGLRRVLLLNGETPTRYSDRADRSVSLLFGDAGSATLLERDDQGGDWCFVLHTDGSGYRDLIIEGGGFRDRFAEERRKHYVNMNGSNIFNFTIRVLPPLIRDTLELSGHAMEEVDYYIFHQSNQFIMKHIVKKTKLSPGRVPIILGEYGNTGGPSVPLTVTQGKLDRPLDRSLSLMLLGYGVGLSWGAALIDLEPSSLLGHVELPTTDE